MTRGMRYRPSAPRNAPQHGTPPAGTAPWPATSPRRSPPPVHVPVAEEAAPRASGDRYTGVCTGFHSVDLWGHIRLDGLEIIAMVSIRDVRDGHLLRTGDRVVCRVEQGKLGWVCRDVERR